MRRLPTIVLVWALGAICPTHSFAAAVISETVQVDLNALIDVAAGSPNNLR